MSLDKIKIKDLEVYGKHGVYKEENTLGQKFLVSVDLYLDTKKAGKSDRMEESVSYAKAAHFMKEFLLEHTYKLLEACAENLCEQLLLKFPLVKKVRMEIKKPWAPILLPLETVSVEIERGWKTAYLALGSNLGEKEENLTKAVSLLEEDQRTRVRRTSSFIVTKPMGNVEQDDFLNGAVAIETLRTPQELLALANEIEEKLKRVRTVRWGPRTIDVDLIFYEEEVVNEENLKIPHPGAAQRDFVLIPLVEIAPAAMHPLLHKNVFQLLADRNAAGRSG